MLWFPEELALKLTEVEYELFRKIPPAEYLRHATLDMNNFKTFESDSKQENQIKSKCARFNCKIQRGKLMDQTIDTVTNLLINEKQLFYLLLDLLSLVGILDTSTQRERYGSD